MLAVSDMADETLLGVSRIGQAASERRGSGGVVHPYRETVAAVSAEPAEVVLYDRDMIEMDRQPFGERVRLEPGRTGYGGPIVVYADDGLTEVFRMPPSGYSRSGTDDAPLLVDEWVDLRFTWRRTDSTLSGAGRAKAG
jgi:hypothetical protein